jgi:hypothetical protein
MLLFDGCVNSCLIIASHSAIGVWHHENAIYSEKVGSQDERSQYVIGYAGASVSQNLRVACLHTYNCKWAYTRIHAGNNR